jgi:hypothetical protein
MAITYPWMEAAYQGVMDWNVSNDQVNPDRGTYKDVLQSSTASKYSDFLLTQGMMETAADKEAKLMQVSADLDRKNTLDLMTAEHTFKTEGMKTSNDLSKDYLQADTYSKLAQIGETGNQQDRIQRTTNQGTRDVANIQREASNYAQDAETGRTASTNQSMERRIGLAGTEDRASRVTQGEQDRLGYRVQGEEQREGIRTQGDENRRYLAFDRASAFQLARQGARR